MFRAWCLSAALSLFAAFPTTAQQPDKPVPVDAPGVAGGKVVLVPRDQLRAGPGVKTARLPHPMRAAISKGEPAAPAVVVPRTWDWAVKDGKRAKLPMMGNDRYGDCYPVAVAKLAVLWAWMVGGQQLAFSDADVIAWYLKVAGGDNGTTDAQIFPELTKNGFVPPARAHRALDKLIIPASDKAALDLTGFCFGPHLFTFTVHSSFMQAAKPGARITRANGAAGPVKGGHAIVLSGKAADNPAVFRNGETWGFPDPLQLTNDFLDAVDPEYVAVFSLEWFDSKGFAPNGLHYNVLAPVWNSIGGSVPAVGPFPDPNPDPNPKPVDPGKFTGTLTTTTTTTFTFEKGVLVKTEVTQGGGPVKLTRAEVVALARAHAKAAGIDWEPLVQLLIDALLKFFASQNMLAGDAAPAAPQPRFLTLEGVRYERGADGVYRRPGVVNRPVLKP